jgi:hypothetical protein
VRRSGNSPSSQPIAPVLHVSLTNYRPQAQSEQTQTSLAVEYFNLGVTLTNQASHEEDRARRAEDIKKANEALDSALGTDPSLATAYYLKGMNLVGECTFLNGSKVVCPEGTEQALRKYLELEPDGKYAKTATGTLSWMGQAVGSNAKPASANGQNQQATEMTQTPSSPAALYIRAIDLLRKSAIWRTVPPVQVSIDFAPGTAAALLVVIKADPTGIWGIEARALLMTKGKWSDWNGQLPPGEVPAQRTCNLGHPSITAGLTAAPCDLKAENLIAEITGQTPAPTAQELQSEIAQLDSSALDSDGRGDRQVAQRDRRTAARLRQELEELDGRAAYVSRPPTAQNQQTIDPEPQRHQAEVDDLQQQITQLESDAEDADNRAVDLERSGSAIERIGAIHLRSQAKSDRRRAESLHSNLAQLDAEAAAAIPESTPRPREPVDNPNAILDAGNQQARVIRGIGDQNVQQQPRAAQERLAAQQAAQRQAARQAAPQTSSSPQPRSYRDMTQCVKVVSATYNPGSKDSQGDVRVVVTNTCAETIFMGVFHYRYRDTCTDGEAQNLTPGASFTHLGETDRNWYSIVADNNTDWAVTGQGPALQIPNSCLDKYPVK